MSSGLYSMCRNPLYLGSMLLALSAAVFLRSAALFGGIMVTSLLYAWLVVPGEERFLAAQLGPPYDDYRRRVRYRLLPFVW